MIRQRVFQIVQMEVQPDQHDTYLGVKDGRVPGSDELVVFGFHIAQERRVRAADIRDVLGLEFLFDASFADDKDFVLIRGELEDARNVDRGAVGRGEDFFLCILLASSSFRLSHCLAAAQRKGLTYRRAWDSQ